MEKTKRKLSKNKKNRKTLSVSDLNGLREKEEQGKLETLTKFKGTAIYPDFKVNEDELYIQEK
jgi:hypothetical protein